MDNQRYQGGAEARPSDQAAALQEVRRLLRPGGCVLVTVPFGRYEDHGWFVNYDLAFWETVVAGSGLTEERREMFGYIARRWRRAEATALVDVGYRTRDARGAAGLLCACLRAQHIAGDAG